MFFDYHIHLENGPLDLRWLERFAAVASSRGVSEIGISEHIFRFREASSLWPAWWDLQPDISLGAYVDLIEKAREAGLPVRLGVECEYLPGIERRLAEFLAEAAWDYVIGSVHFIGPWGFDDTADPRSWEGKDVDEAYRDYFQILGCAMSSGLFDIVGHPDVIKVSGCRPSFDPRPLYEKAAATARRHRVAAEVSTAGLRKPVGEMYPHPEFLAAFRRHGVPIVVSSDAHYPEHVGYEFGFAAAYAAAAGYTEVVRFSRRKAQRVPLEW